VAVQNHNPPSVDFQNKAFLLETLRESISNAHDFGATGMDVSAHTHNKIFRPTYDTVLRAVCNGKF
jgi:hypothetical protein